MSPENRESLMLAAQACADASMPWLAKLLQGIADAVDAGDESAIYWLGAAGHMAAAIWQERFATATGEELAAVNRARAVCGEEWQAAIERRDRRAA